MNDISQSIVEAKKLRHQIELLVVCPSNTDKAKLSATIASLQAVISEVNL